MTIGRNCRSARLFVGSTDGSSRKMNSSWLCFIIRLRRRCVSSCSMGDDSKPVIFGIAQSFAPARASRAAGFSRCLLRTSISSFNEVKSTAGSSGTAPSGTSSSHPTALSTAWPSATMSSTAPGTRQRRPIQLRASTAPCTPPPRCHRPRTWNGTTLPRACRRHPHRCHRCLSPVSRARSS